MAKAGSKKAKTEDAPITALKPGDILEEMSASDPSLVVDEGLNISRGAAYERHELDSIVQSILDVGRVIEPVIARPLDDGTRQIVVGFGRTLGLRIIKQEKLSPVPIPLPVIIRHMTAEEAIEQNLHENHRRRKPSPTDDAVAAKRLKDRGMSVEQIARFFLADNGKPVSPAWVRERIKIAESATPEELKRWRQQEYSAETAMYLVKEFPDPEQRKVVDQDATAMAIEEIVGDINMPLQEARALIEEAKRDLPPDATAAQRERAVKDVAIKRGKKAGTGRKIANKVSQIEKPRPGVKHVNAAAKKRASKDIGTSAVNMDKRTRRMNDFNAWFEYCADPDNSRKVPAPLRKEANAYLEWRDAGIDTLSLENKLRALHGFKPRAATKAA